MIPRLYISSSPWLISYPPLVFPFHGDLHSHNQEGSFSKDAPLSFASFKRDFSWAEKFSRSFILFLVGARVPCLACKRIHTMFVKCKQICIQIVERYMKKQDIGNTTRFRWIGEHWSGMFDETNGFSFMSFETPYLQSKHKSLHKLQRDYSKTYTVHSQ